MAWGLGTLPGAWGHDPIPFAISLGPEPWPWPWASGHCLGLRPSLGFGQGTSQIAKGLMAISLKPWPKILDIRGCAWGKPAGRELPLTGRLATFDL